MFTFILWYSTGLRRDADNLESDDGLEACAAIQSCIESP